SEWDFVKQRALVNKKIPRNAEINMWLDKIEAEVKSVFRSMFISGIVPTSESIKTKLLEGLGISSSQIAAAAKKVDLLRFIQDYIEQSSVSKAKETIKAYKT